MSGDEFVILSEDLAGEDDGAPRLSRIEESFARPFLVGARELAVGATIGVDYAGPGDVVGIEMVDNADTAMYRAKRSPARDAVPVVAHSLLNATAVVTLGVDTLRNLVRGHLRLGDDVEGVREPGAVPGRVVTGARRPG